MATSFEAALAVASITKTTAERMDADPTGIKPGYDPATGIAWRENGTARYRRDVSPLGFLLQYDDTSGISIASNTETRLNFNHQLEDQYGLVTPGASWKFEPPQGGWYAATFDIKWAPSGGDIAAGGNFDMTWWNGAVQQDEIYKWQASQTVPAGTPAMIQFRRVLFFQAVYDVNFRLDNDIGQTLLFSSAFITIEKVGHTEP
jgi:hypothetical protein